MIVLQVDYSMVAASTEFVDTEQNESSAFNSKPRTILDTGESIMFNGVTVSKTSNGYRCFQSEKLRVLQQPKTDKELISTRASLQYIATCTRPDIASATQLLSSDMGNPTSKTYRTIRKIIERATSSHTQGLNFVKLDPENLEILAFADASFENCKDYSSQIGFVICLSDNSKAANVVCFGSQKCKRIT